MSSAVGSQSDLSTMHKSKATRMKAVNREEGKWEKGEVRQHLNTKTINIRTDECLKKALERDWMV